MVSRIYFFLLASLVSSFCNVRSGFGQTIITGRVIDESLDPLPGVDVFDAEFNSLIRTDMTGSFEIALDHLPDTLRFGFVGFESTSIGLNENCKKIELILMYDSYSHDSPKKIDRMRLERFKRLPEIHESAFQQGIFEMRQSCYGRKFIPFRPQIEQIGLEMKKTERESKQKFKELTIGDTVEIPFSISKNYDGTGRTSLFIYSIHAGDIRDCVIEGIVFDKNRRRFGKNVKIKVFNTSLCDYHEIIYQGEELTNGRVIKVNMKYDKISINRN